MNKTITPGKLSGSIPIPASKSHTIRALLIASLAEGESRIIRPLDSADTRACIAACTALGADIRHEGSDLRVKGTGGNLAVPAGTIDVGNSGTTLYLAMSIAALADGTVRFDGDSQIRSRPVKNLLEALRDLGAQAQTEKGNGCAPLTVTGPLTGGTTSISCPTSQYLSSLLLACPLAPKDTVIEVPLLNEQPYVEMTLRWLDEQGIRYEHEGFRKFRIPGNQLYRSFKKPVPADFSSATFFFVAAAVTESKLFLEGLDMDDSQGDKAVVRMMEKMGCRITIEESGIGITGPGYPDNPGNLKGRDFDLNATPDALPAMAVAGCYAEGTTRLLNVPQARMKETDRISVMYRELSKMGADIEELHDGLVIRGRSGTPGSPLTGTIVHGHRDHRVVMSLAVAGLGAKGNTTVDTAEAVDITFPGFFALLEEKTGCSSPAP